MISNLADAAETVELDQGQQGRLSRIDAMQSQKMAEAQIRRARIRRERVENILAQADEPDFGCCGDCGILLPMPRLMARPDSVLCGGPMPDGGDAETVLRRRVRGKNSSSS